MVSVSFSYTIKGPSTYLKKVIQSLPQSEKQWDENVALKFGFATKVGRPTIHVHSFHYKQNFLVWVLFLILHCSILEQHLKLDKKNPSSQAHLQERCCWPWALRAACNLPTGFGERVLMYRYWCICSIVERQNYMYSGIRYFIFCTRAI